MDNEESCELLAMSYEQFADVRIVLNNKIIMMISTSSGLQARE
jgi:hypothetical protein